jgi:hypothetical protein
MAKPRQPEPKFFLVDDIYNRGLEYYSRTWFAAAPPGVVAGEKSTNYLESATAAARMARDLPHAKLVFVLRDPVERAYSNYRWSRMNGLEDQDFATALDTEAAREHTVRTDLRYARPHAYYSRGLYADLLTPFFDRFPREQILCLRFEDVDDARDDLVTRLHAFLGVDVRVGDASGIGVVNASEAGMEPMSEAVRAALTARYEEPNRRLGALLGDDFKGWHAR